MNVDLARVIAPLVINELLGVPVIICSPLIPRVVNPLVMALTLVATLSVGIVAINPAFALSITI